MRAFTKDDVLAYDMGLMTDLAELEAFELALVTDPEVRGWFNRLVDDDPAVRAAFDAGADDLAQRLLADQWARVGGGRGTPPPVHVPKADTLYETADGLVYVSEFHLVAGTSAPPPAVEVPCILPDYRLGCVSVRQKRDALPDGRIDLIVVRRRGSEPPVTYRFDSYQLQEADDCWYDDIPLNLLLPDGYQPAEDSGAPDELVYVLRAAAPRSPDRTEDNG